MQNEYSALTPVITDKLPKVGTTIFSVMSALANEVGAINLSQGFPDFPSDPLLNQYVYERMLSGMNQYAPMPGAYILREAIAQTFEYYYSQFYNPDTEITITSGATEALFAAITAITNNGDEIIIFEPCYDSYIPAIELNGGIAKPLPLSFPDYSIDWDRLADTITDRTRGIIINSPNNPTGCVMTKEDMHRLQNLIESRDIFIISDEVYEHIVFDGLQHQSVSQFPLLKQRSFIIASYGKSLHVTGWKIGYCLAPEALTTQLRKIHQFLTFSSNHPVQLAIADYLNYRGIHLFESIKVMYQQKRDFFMDMLKNSRLKPLKTQGTYFALYSYKEISNENDVDFAKRITRDIGVASIPVSAFYSNHEDNKVIRFCFAKQESTLTQACQALCQL